MKVFVHGASADILKDPVLGFPFSMMTDIELCDDPSKADRIFAPLPILHGWGAAWKVMGSSSFAIWGAKYVFFSCADNPKWAYDSESGLKLLASPLHPPAVDVACNVVRVPLWLGQVAWDVQQDRAFIEELRNVPKTQDFLFVGDMRKLGDRDRSWLSDIHQMGFKLEHRDPCIWTPGFSEKMRSFLREVARAKYCFAPRGVGSSSARLYEAMLVGSVPIVDNSLDMPLLNGVHSFEGVVHAPEKASYPYYTLPLAGKAYRQKREAAMHYWDRYCYLPNCALAIQEQCLT